MAMNTREFDEDTIELDDFSDAKIVVAEINPSTKLERRRRIEDLFEEKRLKEELAEFG
jgi:hypothetical protein